MFVSIYMMITVALGEEVGWRGYALPALQDLSRRETNHVRPATLALEQLLARK